MAGKTGGTEPKPLSYENVAELEGDVTYIHHDERFVYAACTDLKVRVISKSNWQIEVELGDTSSIPLAVHVDDEHVYVTCEKKVYVWNKSTWGMIGWFELSYSVLTSILMNDLLLVGAVDGRLVSIKKDTHETSSWQLYKTDLTELWADKDVIFTGTKKDEPRVWKIDSEAAPAELAVFDKKDKGAVLIGTDNYLISGISTGEIKVYDRVEWALVKTMESSNPRNINSMWANNIYLITLSDSSVVSVWDILKGTEIGSLKINGLKISQLIADHELLILATPDGVKIIRLLIGNGPLDLTMDEVSRFQTSVLITSPYDVLEGVLGLQKKGDSFLEAGQYHDAVKEFENALQLLIDNTHALLEVPDERKTLTTDLNNRLGKSLLKSKIVETKSLHEVIQGVSAEFDELGRPTMEDEAIDRLFAQATRVLKESRVLVEAQAGHILSYQLTDEIDTMGEKLSDAKEKLEQFRETIRDATEFTLSIQSAWRLIERKRTTLKEREEFLTKSIETIDSRISELEEDDDSEVRRILTQTLAEFTELNGQIQRIILAADESNGENDLVNKDEAVAAIAGLLNVLPKKKDVILKMAKSDERSVEIEQLRSALEQALETAKRFKMKVKIKAIKKEIIAIEGLNN